MSDIDDIYKQIIELNNRKSNMVKSKGKFYIDPEDDPEVKEMRDRISELSNKLHEMQAIEIVENSFLFAQNNSKWVMEMKDREKRE